MDVAAREHREGNGWGAAAGPSRVALLGFSALVGVGLVVPAVFFGGALTPILLLGALMLGLLGRGRPVSNAQLLGALALLFGLRVVWILMAEPPLVSDFARYWEIANAWAESGVRYPLAGVYERRAWPYFWPVAALFGGSSWSYRCANLAALAVASFALYRYADWRFGRLNAQAAVLFANLAPETFGATGIASHDVAALLFLSGIGLVVLWLDRLTARGGRIPLLVLGSLLLAGLTKLVEIQRLPATLVIASLLLAAGAGPLVQERGRSIARGTWRLLASRVFFLAVLPALLLAAGRPAIERVIGGPQRAHAAIQQLAFLHDVSVGTYSYKKEVVLQHMADVPSADKRRLARALVLSGWADDPNRRIRNIGLRATRLFNFGSNSWFYAAGRSEMQNRARKTYAWLARGYAVVLGGLLILLPFGLISAARRGEGSADFPLTDWPLVFVACLSLVLLSVSEVQSRYLFPIYFLASPWCLAVASRSLPALVDLGRGEQQAARGLGRDALWTAGAVLAVYLAWLAGGVALDSLYGHGDGRIVNLLSGAAKPSANLEIGKGSEQEHDHADAFGPYDLWIGHAKASPGRPAQLRSRVCGLDPARSWEARLYVERTAPRDSAKTASRCRVGAPGRWRSCDVPAEHRLWPISVPGLSPDGSGCLDFFVRLEPIEGAEPTRERWRIALLRMLAE